MRSESEIKDFIADLEAVLALPGEAPNEFLLRMHICLLQWVLGANNQAAEAWVALRAAMKKYGPKE